MTARIGSTSSQAALAALYIGITNDLVRRIYQHRTKVVRGFTSKYAVHRLVYFEQFDDIEAAIRREKRLKKWKREWKVRMIEETNPNWDDLYPGLASTRDSRSLTY